MTSIELFETVRTKKKVLVAGGLRDNYAFMEVEKRENCSNFELSGMV
jgi:hypothetical protein